MLKISALQAKAVELQAVEQGDSYDPCMLSY
jgi:hypothetical protein